MKTSTFFEYILIVSGTLRAIYAQGNNSIGCIDNHDIPDACEWMFEEGNCETDIAALQMRCDKTCGWCSNGKRCADVGKYLKCKSLSRDECDANPTFYFSRCRKSCNWCGKDVSVWMLWGGWSSCSATCGSGTRQRSRECFSGKCSEDETEFEDCQSKQACARWTEWGQWTACRATCGESVVVRVRQCDGRGCEGERYETKTCQVKPCDSDWGDWGPWSACSESCGQGIRRRDRKCTENQCDGSDRDVGICFVKECPFWFDWGPWGSCSVTCGIGEKIRKRECNNGPGCVGDSEAKASCELPSCSGTGLKFGVWTECSRSCGSGTRMKLEKCEANDVNICPIVYKDCNTFRCRPRECKKPLLYRYGYEQSSCCNQSAVTCGRGSSVSDRIIGGKKSELERFPWMARLEMKHHHAVTSNYVCGGTLIHAQYVLTAAHCVAEFSHDELIVVLGSISVKDTSTYVQRMALENMTVHPQYHKPKNDVALLKLMSPVSISRYVDILCMPNGEELPLDTRCFAAGWGLTHFLATRGSSELMEVAIRKLPFDACHRAYMDDPTYGPHMDSEKMMCAGVLAGGAETCQGDSGGPLMCQRCSSCSWYIAGVTSFGTAYCGEANLPGVYMKVTAYEDWISTLVDRSDPHEYSCPTAPPATTKPVKTSPTSATTTATTTQTTPTSAAPGPTVKFDEWGECSRTCGGGTRVKVLSCPHNDTNKCPKVYEDCNTFRCRYTKCKNPLYHRYGLYHSSCCKAEASNCGQEKSVQDRIIGGRISKPKQFPWMARLEYDGSTCGGTLIHAQHVLTAAHCLKDVVPSDIVIVLGSISRIDTATHVQKIRAANFNIHPNYQFPRDDIAIIKLKSPAYMTEQVRIICLPNGEDTPVDDHCFAAGWGLRHPTATKGTRKLLEVKLRHLPFDVCQQAYGKQPEFIGFIDENKMMCAGQISGEVDTCRGDSGGPFMCQRCSSCSWYLAGVTSFGAPHCGEINSPGVYTRVRAYQEWISTLVESSETVQYSC